MERKKVFLMVAIIGLLCMAAGKSEAGVICLDAQGYCNDLKLFFSHSKAEISEVHGYEYGCGDLSRGLSGTRVKSGTHKHFGLTGTFNGATQVGSIYIDYDTLTKTGAGGYAYISDSYISGSVTYVKVPCSSVGSSPVKVSEPDLLDATQ